MRHHYTLITGDTIKKTDHIPSAGKDMEGLDTPPPSIKPFKKLKKMAGKNITGKMAFYL